jgi:phosphatidylserine/phosphatidylglycerophosphate/cardiolipin synthase-like enzyme
MTRTPGHVLVAIGALSRADPAPTIQYAPTENLEHIDVELIDSARREIDFADWPVIQALTRAADRGIKVRIHLDNGRLAEPKSSKPFRDLATTPDVEIRAKGKNSALMHLKSYQIDGRVAAPGPRSFQLLASSAKTMTLS